MAGPHNTLVCILSTKLCKNVPPYCSHYTTTHLSISFLAFPKDLFDDIKDCLHHVWIPSLALNRSAVHTCWRNDSNLFEYAWLQVVQHLTYTEHTDKVDGLPQEGGLVLQPYCIFKQPHFLLFPFYFLPLHSTFAVPSLPGKQSDC